MLKGNDDQADTGANMPQLHSSCYQVKAKQAARHTMSPCHVGQEWQAGDTENSIGCLFVFFVSLTSIYKFI